MSSWRASHSPVLHRLPLPSHFVTIGNKRTKWRTDMTERNRTMINIDPSVFEEMKVLSDATGIPIATYGKLLIQSGLPILRTMRDAIVDRDDFINNKLDAFSSMIEDLKGEAQEVYYDKMSRPSEAERLMQREVDKFDEYQHELENLSK